MGIGGAVSRSVSLFKGQNSIFRNKESGKLRLPGIISGNTVGAIKYDEALAKIKTLKNKLIQQLNNLDKAERSNGYFFWLDLYILALSAQEKMIRSINDGFIASDIPWDLGADIPSVSSTIGDALNYAERLKDPKDHFLKALLLSFSGWTLLSTEKNKCVCGKGQLQDLSIDVLVQTDLKINRETSRDHPIVSFYIGVQSDDHDHLERHYSFKEKSVRHEGLIIIHRSTGYRYKVNGLIYSSNNGFQQAEQFRVNKIAELLDGLISSFSNET